uniref:Uncharacterized protein n=1 Tax=Acrobeloides nanus TaxID=290746 RepID=A0A914DFF3_9BILA
MKAFDEPVKNSLGHYVSIDEDRNEDVQGINLHQPLDIQNLEKDDDQDKDEMNKTDNREEDLQELENIASLPRNKTQHSCIIG